MKLNRLFFITFVWVLTPGPDLISQAQHRVNEMLVSTDWLEENLSDSLLVILHYGMKTEFIKEHIPGARYISIWELLVENEQGIRHELPDEQTSDGSFFSIIMVLSLMSIARPLTAWVFHVKNYWQ